METQDQEGFALVAYRYEGHVGDQGGFIADIELELDLFVAVDEEVGVEKATMRQISALSSEEWRGGCRG